MPVCKKTIPEAIKNSKYKPRKGGQGERCEIPFAQSFWNPAKEIEDDERDMKYEEGCVGDLIGDLVFHLVRLCEVIQKLWCYKLEEKKSVGTCFIPLPDVVLP